jgi:hypothetical protein
MLSKKIEKRIKLLEENGYTLKDVVDKFDEVVSRLEKKSYANLKTPWNDKEERQKVPLGEFVKQKQSGYPFKIFILQEIKYKEGTQIRIGYYMISPKKLKQERKLKVVWGQFNPHLPKEDLKELIKKAEKKGIL